MIQLYHCPFTRSHLIRFALEELGLAYELCRVAVGEGEHKSAAYLQVNPLGQLPALVDGDVTLCEAAAIALYLADRAGDHGLAPRVGCKQRGLYYHWVVFAVASELLALSKIALHTRVLPEAARLPAVAACGQRDWADVARALSLGLGGQRFLLGDTFTMADVMVGGALSLAQVLGVLSPHRELADYFARIAERPAFQRAYADSVPA